MYPFNDSHRRFLQHQSRGNRIAGKRTIAWPDRIESDSEGGGQAYVVFR